METTISIITIDFNISLKPNSLIKTMKVAIQGKYIARIVEPTISCFKDRFKGRSIPTATSFLKKPIIKAPIASWGVMINDSLAALRYYPWRLFFPSFMLCLTMLGFNLFSEGLIKAFDPRDSK